MVLRDAPQHARTVTMTRRELREEAQHVVEEHNVDDSMDGEVAYVKHVGKDEEADTCTEVGHRVRLHRLVGADPE